MKIYLDNCCYNRPYDNLSQLTVSLEAQAKLQIQSWIRDGKFELVTSEMLMKEVSDTPNEIRKTAITEYILENSSIHVGPSNNEEVNRIAKKIMETGIKYKDACHIASAMIADCNYVISTDHRMLKYKSEKTLLFNPIDFVKMIEEGEENG